VRSIDPDARRGISVVIPVKNDAEMLERCLHSLTTQTRVAAEIVVVDNASTDASAAVALAFGARVVREDRPGITAAASAGYDVATGEIIARCDADSVLPAEWLARIERVLSSHPDATAVTGPGYFYDLGRVSNFFARIFYTRAYFAATRAATATVPVFGSNFAIRRAAWQAVSATVPRDSPDLHDDMDLSFRLPATSRIVYDRTLVVGISGRPFRSASGMRRRFRMAHVTVWSNVRRESPPLRWWRFLRAAR
jgi:glycosyltransferase involved in cell wall biosynthesis